MDRRGLWVAAATFVLLGTGLLLLVARTPAWDRTGEWFLAGSLSVPVGVLVGYLFRVIPTQAPGQGIQMAAHTAGGITALAIGGFVARPDREFVSALRSRGPGAALARRLLPAAMAIPVALNLHPLGEASASRRNCRVETAPCR